MCLHNLLSHASLKTGFFYCCIGLAFFWQRYAAVKDLKGLVELQRQEFKWHLTKSGNVFNIFLFPPQKLPKQGQPHLLTDDWKLGLPQTFLTSSDTGFRIQKDSECCLWSKTTVTDKENNENPEAAVNSWKELCAKVKAKIFTRFKDQAFISVNFPYLYWTRR